MTIQEALKQGMKEIKSTESPKLKARLLMQYILKQTRQYVIVNDMKELDKMQEKQYFEAIDKIKKGFPIEHIIHQKEFMKLNFFVDENVLIPRQDTEILVEEVIEIANKIGANKILDLCTGSGAIGISLAKYLNNCGLTLVDISKEAMQIAKKNANINEVESKITFIHSNLFDNLESQKFDIIVSNPPYIKTEPNIALNGGQDGLDFYRKIIKEAYKYLNKGGYLCLEIGFDQKYDVIELIENEEKFEQTYSKKDLYDNDRIIITKLK